MTTKVTMTRYEQCIRDANRAFAAAVAAAAELPELPDTGCVCGAHTDGLLLEEYGYSRWTSLRREPLDSDPTVSFWCAYGDGWDDMSESGNGPEVVWCERCDTYYRRPDDLEWL